MTEYEHLIGRLTFHEDFAAGYAAQQMLDRENGRIELASYAQGQAALHADAARRYREMAVAARPA